MSKRLGAFKKSQAPHFQRYNLDVYIQEAKKGLYRPPNNKEEKSRKKYNFSLIQTLINDRFSPPVPSSPQTNTASRDAIYLQNLQYQLQNRMKSTYSHEYELFCSINCQELESDLEDAGRRIWRQRDYYTEEILTPDAYVSDIKPLTMRCIECIVEYLPTFEQLPELVPYLPPDQVEYLSFCLGVHGVLNLDTYSSVLQPLLQEERCLPPIHLSPQLPLTSFLQLLQLLQSVLRGRGQQSESSWERLLEQPQPLVLLPQLLPCLVFLPGCVLRPSELLLLGRHGVLQHLQVLHILHADIATQDCGVDEDALLQRFADILCAADAVAAADSGPPVLGYYGGRGATGTVGSAAVQRELTEEDASSFFGLDATSNNSSSGGISTTAKVARRGVALFSLLRDVLSEDAAASRQLDGLDAAGRQAVCLLCLLSSARYLSQLYEVRFSFCHFVTEQVLRVWLQLLVRMKTAGLHESTEGISYLVPLSPIAHVSIKGLEQSITSEVSRTHATLGHEQQCEVVRLKLFSVQELVVEFSSRMDISIELEL
eukprot:gene30755-37159_t